MRYPIESFQELAYMLREVRSGMPQPSEALSDLRSGRIGPRWQLSVRHQIFLITLYSTPARSLSELSTETGLSTSVLGSIGRSLCRWKLVFMDFKLENRVLTYWYYLTKHGFDVAELLLGYERIFEGR